MLLDKKKGNIVAQFVVLIVIAVIMIFVVTAFGAKIWSSFFPNEDKSSLSSFEALFSVIEAKSVSQAAYDSTTLNVYLKKDYNIAFFTNGKADCKETHWYGNTITPYNAPSECEVNKRCLCLYDGKLSREKDKEDKNLVKCHSITNPITIDRDYFYLNNGICSSQDQYNSYIIARYALGATPYLYILPDTEEFRNKDAEWSIPICPKPTGTTQGNMCSGLSYDTIIDSTDETSIKNMYNYCKSQQNIISTRIKCTPYDGGTTGADVRECTLDCDFGSITHESLRSCSSFNRKYGPNNERYVSKNENFKYYYMCDHDADYYKNGCDISQWNVYICKASVNGADDVGATTPTCHPTDADWTKNCDIEYADADGLYSTNGKFIVSYNTSNSTCRNYMNKNYYTTKGTAYACKSDIQACKTFITDYKESCTLKYMSANDKYWITYFDTRCTAQVQNLFEIAYFCTETNP